MKKYLRLNLDEMHEQGYYYTNYDLGGSGHSITIDAEFKEEFLDQFAAIWRKRAEELLEVDEDFEEEE